MEHPRLEDKEVDKWQRVSAEVWAILNSNSQPKPALEKAAHDKIKTEYPNESEPELSARLGNVYFSIQEYEDACRHYGDAVRGEVDYRAAHPQLEPSIIEETLDAWRELRDASNGNVLGGIQNHVPAKDYFTRQQLLGAPEDPELPEPPDRIHTPYQLYKLRYLGPLVGKTVGRFGSGLFNGLVNLFGWHYKGATLMDRWKRLVRPVMDRYRSWAGLTPKGPRHRNRLWTNWYRKHPWFGIFNLAFMRDQLYRKNLYNVYPGEEKTAFQPGNLAAPTGVKKYRTADGSWNNLKNPREGAAKTRFLRNVNASAANEAHEVLDPSPREISRHLLTRGEQMREIPFLNMLAAAWIQFENHDWISHGENLSDESFRIKLADDDPARAKYMVSEMEIPKTQKDMSRNSNGDETWNITHINEVTHWWDASQIYGSDVATQKAVRSNSGGRLKIDAEGLLPVSDLKVELTGFSRNWWVGLAMLHTLFAREHNAICDHLQYHYPSWDDDQLFNVARLINAAVIAKIHSVEWTPAVLPNPRLNTALNSNWYGLLTYLKQHPERRKTVATFNIQSPELGGIVGNSINTHGCPYGLTQEFVEVYRLHSLLPEHLQFNDHRTGRPLKRLAFGKSRQSASPGLTREIGMENLFYSFGNQHPGYLGLNNFPRFMQELSVPGTPFLDLGAVDILRARERGVPRYNEFRRQLNLNPITTFRELTDNQNTIDKLTRLYGEGKTGVEKLDLLIGTLAEERRPTYFGFGETMFQIFILNASRRLQADRFYTTDYREDVYTRQGMQWIDRASFKSVILRHYPELEATGLGNIANAFEPWDESEILAPDRHPLRAYAPELKADPWRGDAYV